MKKAFLKYLCLTYIIITLLLHNVFHTSWELMFRDVIYFLCFREGIGWAYISFLGVLLLYGHMIYIKRITLEWTIRVKDKVFHIRPYIRKLPHFLILCAGILIVNYIAIWGRGGNQVADAMRWNTPVTIAHAGGIIDEFTYSNCLEAILTNYEKGHRTFEIDFALTRDKVLVGKHDWEHVVQEGTVPGYVPTKEEFLSLPIYGQYTPITFRDLCLLMDEFPDMWVVTDTKNAVADMVKEDITLLVETARELEKENILDRIVIQIYNEEMYAVAREVYPFENWIYTLYQTGWEGREELFPDFARFCSYNGIDTIAMSEACFTKKISKIAEIYDVDVYVHTVNNVENAQEYIDQGAIGVYTDSITPEELRRNKK